MNTAEIIQDLNHRFQVYRNISAYPSIEYFRHIRGKHAHSELSATELKFLHDISNKSIPQLENKAFILGEWYDCNSYGYQYYNLTNKYRSKLVKKCKPLKNMQKIS